MRQKRAWKNWAHTASCRPESRCAPRDVGDVQAAVSDAVRRRVNLKVAATGHSFTDIACTDGVLVSMREFSGLTSHDTRANTAGFGAATRIVDAADALSRVGLGFSSLGDIGYQTVAGAVATGTHGTSARIPSLSGQLSGLTLVSGTAEVVECSTAENRDVFLAACVGLGALGIVTEVTFEAESAFNLETRSGRLPIEDTLADLDALVDANEHFEFFWFPHTRTALTTSHNRTDALVREPKLLKDWFYTVAVGNYLWDAYLRVGKRRPDLIPAINRRVISEDEGGGEFGIGRGRVSRSDHAFTNERRVRFAEMEYSVPREAIVEVFNDVRTMIERAGFEISFPLEVRFGPGEQAWLSPATERDSAWLAVHTYHGMPFRQYFRAVEQIVNRVGGRPHWGKLHSQTAESLAGLFPQWESFRRIRRELDPQGVFANPYLDRVLGPIANRA